jgi:hypothetical protein
MPTLPGGGPALTVEVLLKNPAVIARALTNLTHKRFLADRVLAHGSPESVAGGAVKYQRSESIFPDDSAETMAPRTAFRRTGWSEAVLTADVVQYGLEIPINKLSVRRNQRDQLQRGLIKLANGMVRDVDSDFVTTLTTDPDRITFAASADWSTPSTDIIADIAEAKRLVSNEEEGYELTTMIVHDDQAKDLLVDAEIREAMPRENASNPAMTGRPAPMLGLEEILVSNTVPAGEIILLHRGVTGTITDETPDASEGYSSFVPSPEHNPIYTRTYVEEHTDDWIIRAARWPVMYVAEPKSIVHITSA